MKKTIYTFRIGNIVLEVEAFSRHEAVALANESRCLYDENVEARGNFIRVSLDLRKFTSKDIVEEETPR